MQFLNIWKTSFTLLKDYTIVTGKTDWNESKEAEIPVRSPKESVWKLQVGRW